jgi:transposase
MTTTVIGIDLGKRWFHVVGRDQRGNVTLRQKFNRAQLIEFVARHPCCLIGMETCCGSQHFARKFVGFGHDVRLLPAQFVKPFVKSQKNDFNDALAISEAVVLPTMRFVPIRTEEQMDVQALHRARERLIQQRLAMTNQIRGLLLDRGIEIAQGFHVLRTSLPKLLASEGSGLTPMMRNLGELLLKMWRQTEEAIDELNRQIQDLAKGSELCRRLQSIPGVGPLLATAIVASVGNGSQFKRARDLPAWIGIVPRQLSTGGQTRLVGISKRGNSYLRRLFVQGSRALWVWKDKHPNDPLQRWLIQLGLRRHPHVAVCALANKLARIAWAVMRSGQPFQSHHRSTALAAA